MNLDTSPLPDHSSASNLIPAWVDNKLQPVEKLAVHQRGLKHLAISIFLTSGDRILIQKRAAGKYHTPNLWANTVCTHPHWQEDTATAAHRRLMEELGIQNVSLDFIKQLEYRADVGGGLIEHEMVDVFTAEIPMDHPMAPNPSEVAQTRWITRAELVKQIAKTPANFTPWLRIYMRDHADEILKQ